MTKREFLDAIINKNLTDETTAFATKELAQLDATLEKRRNTLSPKQEENLKLVELVVDALTEEPMTATQVYELGIEGVTSVQKASSLLRMAAKNDLVIVSEVAVKGRGKQKAYAKA
jgi:thiazole synthase ThiGH ThiG subunit